MTSHLLRRSALAAALAAFGIAAQAADIKLGAAEALSGPAGQYGQSIKNGFDLAVAEINAAGGVNGNKLVLQVEDEAGQPRGEHGVAVGDDRCAVAITAARGQRGRPRQSEVR